MSAIRTTFGGSVSVNGALNVAGTASASALSLSGFTINAISDDASMAAASDSKLPTYAAMKQYTEDRDAVTLAAAKDHVDRCTGSSYAAPSTFGVLTDTATITVRNAVDDHTLTFVADPVHYNVNMIASHPGDAVSPGFTSRTVFRAEQLAFYGNIYIKSDNPPWQVVQLYPRSAVGVTGPVITQCVDWGTYLFPGTSDATYFTSAPVPFSAGTPVTPGEMRLYIRYSMSASSSAIVKFRTTWQAVAPGGTVDMGTTVDTDLVPAGAANVMNYVRLAVPLTTPVSRPTQLFFAFTRLGATDANAANMSVWAISLVYNNIMWGALPP